MNIKSIREMYVDYVSVFFFIYISKVFKVFFIYEVLARIRIRFKRKQYFYHLFFLGFSEENFIFTFIFKTIDFC